MHNGVALIKYVNFAQLPTSAHSFSAAVGHLAEPEGLSRFTGLNWVMCIAAAHVLGKPLLIVSATYNVAVRFAYCEVEVGAYAEAAHLGHGTDWVRLLLMADDAFVPLTPAPNDAVDLLSMLDTKQVKMLNMTVGGRLVIDQRSNADWTDPMPY